MTPVAIVAAPPASTGGGEGPPIRDDVRFRFTMAETNLGQGDAMSVAFAFPETNPALTDAAAFRLLFPDVNPELADALTQLRLTIGDTNPAVNDVAAFTLRPAYGDTVPGQSDSAAYRISGLGDTTPAQTEGRSASLTWTNGAGTGTQTGNWTTPANAAGLRNANNATLTDAATNSNAGTLSLTAYPDAPTDLQSWTVTGASLVSYHAVTNWVGITNTLVVSYNVGGGWQTMWTITANENFAAVGGGRQFILPTLTWAQINALEVRFVYTADLVTNTATVNVDAVELVVTATKNPL